MDPRLLGYYNRELEHIREMCGEFAKEYPKIAGRLGLEGFECVDPYVERLIEGFAYMAARVQLKVDAEFPRFSQNLLEMVYPGYLSPTPSMGIVQFEPDVAQSTLVEGPPVPRGTALFSLLGKGMQTSCEYRTAHDVVLWPITVGDCAYIPSSSGLAALGVPEPIVAKAGIRIRLQTTSGVPFDKLSLDSLVFFIRGGDRTAVQIYEQMVANSLGAMVRPRQDRHPRSDPLPLSSLHPCGLGDDDALLPLGPRSFGGYRLLHEYFAMPERYLFVKISGLSRAARNCYNKEMELIVLLDRSVDTLDRSVDRSRFLLYCAPVINVFAKHADRIHLTDSTNEYHVVADRTRPLDFEVYGVTSVVGYGTGSEPERAFLPFYACCDHTDFSDAGAYYTVQRMPRVVSTSQRLRGPRTRYIGSETFVSLVDATQASSHTDLRQLGVTTLCTNRDLPLMMPVGDGDTDFTFDVGAPARRVRLVFGPTPPRPSAAQREIAWRLISHLSLNYLSLMDEDQRQGAAALRELLELYAATSESSVRKQIAGVLSVSAGPVFRRIPIPGPITFGRGLEVTIHFDEEAFEGSGVFVLGSVLERFFARYVSVNSFTETVLRTRDRGEIMRWPSRIGQRHLA